MKSVINKSMAKVKLPKKKVAIVNEHPYTVEYEKDYAGVEVFSHCGSVSLSVYADYKTGKFLKSEIADLQAFQRTLGDVIAYLEKRNL
jgi:hypothetical protein